MESTARRSALLGTLLASSLALGGGCGEDDSLPHTLVLGSPDFCSNTLIHDFVVDGARVYILERDGESTTRLLSTSFDGEAVVVIDSLYGYGSRIRVVGNKLEWHQSTWFSNRLVSFDRDRGEVVRSTTFEEAIKLLDLQHPDQMIGAGTSEEPARILISDSLKGVLAADLASGHSVVVGAALNQMSLSGSSSSSEGTALRLVSGELLVIGGRLESVAIVSAGGGGVLAGTDGVLYVNGEDLELLTWGTLERIPLGATFLDSQVRFFAFSSDYQDRENWALSSRWDFGCSKSRLVSTARIINTSSRKT